MNIKDGDVFFWSWKHNDQLKINAGTQYWCMDQQCVAIFEGDKLHLVDTYNYDQYKKGPLFAPQGFYGEFTKYLDISLIDLTFKCNTSEIKLIQEYDTQDYDVVYNLSYQKNCRKMYAVDKVAEKSKEAILEKLRGKLKDAEYKKKSAEWNIESLVKEIKELEITK